MAIKSNNNLHQGFCLGVIVSARSTLSGYGEMDEFQGTGRNAQRSVHRRT